MVPRLREEYDADLITPNEPTEVQTPLNVHALPCSACGRTLYVDRQTYESYEKALRHDTDNQYICPDCEREYQDLAYE